MAGCSGVHLSSQVCGMTTSRVLVQANLSKKQDCFSEIAQNGVMAQVAEHLPSKCEALSSNSSPAKKKKWRKYATGLIRNQSWVPMAHTYNPSYSGGRDQEDCGLKPAWANSPWDPISKKPSQNRASGVAQGEGPEFKCQYCKKKINDLVNRIVCNNTQHHCFSEFWKPECANDFFFPDNELFRGWVLFSFEKMS
jgi:hypothetical protein